MLFTCMLGPDSQLASHLQVCFQEQHLSQSGGGQPGSVSLLQPSWASQPSVSHQGPAANVPADLHFTPLWQS